MEINIDLLEKLVAVSMISSVIACALIQKTKGLCKKSKIVMLYSLVVNMGLGIAFCLSFTKFSLVNGVWVGLFSFVGADTLYKALEGKLKPYKELKKEPTRIERNDV